MSARVYLDWNASAPLRPEARAAMLEAMDVVGNPSSVHTEGRAARAIVEKARGQVANLIDAETDQIIFTSGATEAASMADEDHITVGSALEHDCVFRTLVAPWADRGIDLIQLLLQPLGGLGPIKIGVEPSLFVRMPS